MQFPVRKFWTVALAGGLGVVLLLCSGCGEPPAPTPTPMGGDLIVHHQLDYFRALTGSVVMFRDEAVVRFLKTPAVEPATTGPWVLGFQNDPKTQLGSERLHPFMSAPLRPMPELSVTPESHPPEMPQAAQAYRVRVESHWNNFHLRDVDAETDWVVGLDPATGQVLFQLAHEDRSELTNTSYTWRTESHVLPLSAGGGGDAVTVGVGEFSQESLERVQILLQEVPALGEYLRNALRDESD